MEGYYTLNYGAQPVGKVEVKRQGLYYRFRCRCRLPGDGICRVAVVVGGCQENLGILVPQGDGFALEKTLAASRLGEGTPEFLVLPGRTRPLGGFVPIKPEGPFAYIARLKSAYLANRCGVWGIVLEEENSRCFSG